jgi:hypothetical protein
MLWCLTYNLNLSNQRDSTDWELKISTFTESISILVIDWQGLSRSPNSAISSFFLHSCYTFSAIPEPENRNRLLEGNTRTYGQLSLYHRNKICRAAMTVCTKYSTFSLWQEFCTIFLAEKHKVLNLVSFYISTHAPSAMESVDHKSLPSYFAICMAQLSTSWSSNQTGVLSYLWV